MKISACVIVKNEEKNIEAWLNCMEKLADEIIVVDTGSTDRTMEIVGQSRAKLYHFTWINDFAAAKNFALSKAHGDWIAFLDADETFRQEAILRIRKLLLDLHKRKKIAGVMCRLINIDVNDNKRFIGSSVQLRLFRNKSWLKYVGRIHEALTVPKGYVVELVDDIEIFHTGYSAGVVKAKLQRNLELLNEKIAGQGGTPTPRDNRYLMDCHYGLGNYQKSLYYARQSLSEGEKLEDTLPHIYIIYVSSHLFGNLGYEKTLAAFAEARQACPDMPDFPLMQGLYLYEQKNYLESAELLQEGLDMAGHPRPINVGTVADNKRRFLPNAYWVMAKYHRWRRESSKALELCLEGLKIYVYHEELLGDLVQGLLSAGYKDLDIIELLNALYDPKEDAQFLVRALKKPEHRGIYLYYARKAGATEEVKSFQMAECWGAAALQSAYRLEWLLNIGVSAGLAAHISPQDKLHLLLPGQYRQLWQKIHDGKEMVSARGRQRAAAIQRLVEQIGEDNG